MDDELIKEPMANDAAPRRAAEGQTAIDDAEHGVAPKRGTSEIREGAADDDAEPANETASGATGATGASVPVGRTTEDARADVRPAPRKRRKVSLLSVIGLLLLSLGLGSLAYMGWQYYGTNIVSAREATKGKETLRDKWNQERQGPRPTAQETLADGSVRPKKPLEGEWMAIIRIPALGDDYEWPVVAGVTDEVLAKGLGWYTETAMPGAIGNFAIAGHRITHGEPFAKLLELNKGDKVIVETRDAIFTYELYTAPRDLTVKNTDVYVIDPVPGKKDVKPTEAIMTLTTCTNLFASPERSVAFAKLIDKKQV